MTKSVVFVVQQERKGGQVGSERWYWSDHPFRQTYKTYNEALDGKRSAEIGLPPDNRFHRGYRIIKRTITTVEQVME